MLPITAEHALHGGPDGFDRKLWQITEIEGGAQPRVTLAYASADGEEGYPGRLDVRVTYRLTGPSELSVSFTAKTDRPTIVNLTNHSFFNLEGAASGADILGHRLTIAAERFLAIDPDAIPLPEAPRSVAGTPLDFRNPSTIGARIRDGDAQLRNGRGYDHNFCLEGASGLRLAARLEVAALGTNPRASDRSARPAALLGKLSRRFDCGKARPAVPAVGCDLP